LWYIALGGLSISQAAILQLFVPIIAAIGGVIFANESISSRLIISSAMVLGGIVTLMFGRRLFMVSSTKEQ
jgi:drug/metabolite transporter (DMT)-like permease